VNINKMLGEGKPNICDICQSKRKPEENEAKIHHGAWKLECIDRKSCERRKRKNKPK